MILLINTASTYKGGGVQNAKSFIEECRHIQGNEYHIIYGPSLADKINIMDFPDNFHFYKIEYRPATRILSLNLRDSFFKEIEQKVKPDVVFTTSGPAYWKPNAPHLVGYNLAHYIYPESPFFKKISFKKKLKWKLKGLVIKYYFKRDSEHFVVQTEDINMRLSRWLNTDKVYTVSNTCNKYYYNPKIFPAKLPRRKEDEFRLLLFSAYYYHKNFEIIPRIIDELPENYRDKIKFVLTLEKDVYKRVFAPEYYKSIYNVGPVKIEEGPSLYKECDAMFLPTLLECFSASYPEAMIMEKPIITTDLGFARSICGEAALYFSPLEPKDAAAKIVTVVSDPGIRQSLINNGRERLKLFLRPDERAREYLRICQSILNEK